MGAAACSPGGPSSTGAARSHRSLGGPRSPSRPGTPSRAWSPHRAGWSPPSPVTSPGRSKSWRARSPVRRTDDIGLEDFNVGNDMIRRIVAGALVSAIAVPTVVLGQELFIYPDRGQSAEQQSMDKFQCYQWAVQQTGFNPTQPQTAYAAAPMYPP